MMASLSSFLVVFVVLSVSSASPAQASYQRRKKEKVVNFNMDVIEGGIGYTEKIEVDLGKQTELFQVPSHPGVDRSDVLHDFKSMIIKETRRVYSRWVLDEEVNDRSLLGEELNEYCAQYTMYHVTEKWEQVTAEQTGRTSPNRVRRQSGSGLNGTKLCRGGMDLNSALQVCPEPKMKCNERFMCSQINRDTEKTKQSYHFEQLASSN
ncbi:hypothetical protein AWC38_SpisGene6335 [Stylophora pistillata]|uniref:Uncharacterized protein n=1 Tax=Stylophora pistillata TaxID=50429 RepID=A0A2B4SKG4_STYPI|nr:hypothetical protein AWC38_SpisGene6335 [Stylophora pistillata]